jgi:hypothetical protein
LDCGLELTALSFEGEEKQGSYGDGGERKQEKWGATGETHGPEKGSHASTDSTQCFSRATPGGLLSHRTSSF